MCVSVFRRGAAAGIRLGVGALTGIAFAVSFSAPAAAEKWSAPAVVSLEAGDAEVGFDEAGRGFAFLWSANASGPVGWVAGSSDLTTWRVEPGPSLDSPSLLFAEGSRVFLSGTALTPGEARSDPRAVVAELSTTGNPGRLYELDPGRDIVFEDSYIASVTGPDVAADANVRGDAVFAWVRDTRRQDVFGIGPFVSVRPARGSFTKRVDAGRAVGRGAYTVRAAIGEDGEILIAWTSAECEDRDGVYLRRRSPLGRWGQPRRVGDTDAGCDYPADLSVDIGPRGSAVVAWTDRSVLASTRMPGGAFSKPRRLGTTGSGVLDGYPGPLLARVTPRGNALVAWSGGVRRQPEQTRLQPAVATLDNRGRLLQKRLLSAPNVYAVLSDIAVDSRGGALVAWKRLRADGDRDTLFSTALSPAGALGPPRLIAQAPGGGVLNGGRIAIDPNTRTAVVLWRDEGGLRSAVMTADETSSSN